MRGRAGFTLVEVLVAAGILIVGLLATLTTLDSSRTLTLVSERQTSAAHRAQLELERVKSLPYGKIGLTGASSLWSTTPGDFTYVAPSTCPPSGNAPTYQPDHSPGGSTATEPLVMNGCTYTLAGATQTFSGGAVAPATAWSDGHFSGETYDFITWTSDPTCAATATPGQFCSTTSDYKRITIVVTVAGATQPSKPAIVSGFVANPNAVPFGTSPNQQNPVHLTTCTNAQGQVISCSNTPVGTPHQYFLTDTPYQNTYSPPSCDGNVLHKTLGLLGLLAPSPDLLISSLPTGSCSPGPPCSATDLLGGCSGTPLVPSGNSACGSPPSDNTKSHTWVTPAIPAGSQVNLTGKGTMTAYVESASGVSVSATVCVALYVIPGGILSVLNNVLATPIGITGSATVQASAGVPTPVSFDLGGVGQAVGSVTGPLRIEVVLWVQAAASTDVSLVEDQAQFASQVNLMET